MAKTRGPLLSFRARGQIGKAIVMSSWRGISYARQYVEPAFTNTVDQQSTRTVFSWLNAHYARMGSIQLQPWDLATVGRPRTGRNQMIATNLPGLRPAGSIADFIGSPGAKGGPAPDDFTAIPGGASGEIDVEIVPPAPPTGWLVASASFAIIVEQDPHAVYQGQPKEQSVASPGPYTYTFTALTPSATYQCLGWVVYTRPDGTLAVSISAIVAAAATP